MNIGNFKISKKSLLKLGFIIFGFLSILSGCLEKNSMNDSDILDKLYSYMEKEFGENWSLNYQISDIVTSPFIEDDHRFVRIESYQNSNKTSQPKFSLFIIDNNVQSISPQQYNKIMKKYNQKKIITKYDALAAFGTYLQLYGLFSEEIFTENQLYIIDSTWNTSIKKEIDLNLSDASNLTIYKNKSFLTVDLYTLSVIPSNLQVIPSPSDVIFTHYTVDISEMGEVVIRDRTQNIYSELLPSGNR